ncbi:FAD-dependent oxidoreductase [Fimbriiglobus ruber]|uniref:Flavin-dependent monooxygenase n=1 Tax=Fimbriiglobus ruber TaxID=1908690 RepID=A0A225E1P7_9BACT|nr:NAD(P)/FAD-dependent oxidoreductase [Fimbriiglobus ruber]OWK45704.1 Kynurenine 3-monooxygenase [Fimbriiglobus ruber]
MKTRPRIAIIGGGPGGLTLARILHVNGIAATVFEQEDHPLARPQGGTLDIHADSGQVALARAGLTAEFRRIARYEDQGDRLLDKTGKVLFEQQSAVDGDRPEVDRTALREILLASLPAHGIQWSRNLHAVLPRDDGAYDLSFGDLTVGPFDLVVGADGTWSRVRPLVSPYKPQYTGVMFIEFGIDDVDARHPELSRLVGRGKMEALGDGKALIAQRNGNAHIRGYAIFRVPEGWPARAIDFSSPATARAGLIAQFDGWAPDILDLIRACNDRILARPIYGLPVGHRWPNRVGVTLLGDAAHVMSPFGGDGVNNALFDAAELARWIAESEDWAEAVRAYEADMFERVVESAAHAAEAVATLLSHDDPALTLEHLRHRGQPAPDAA